MPPVGELTTGHIRRMQGQSHEGFLKTLLSHWDSTHAPDLTFSLPTLADGKGFYRAYRRVLGMPPLPDSEDQVPILFARAYEHLEHGESDQAREQLRLLISHTPSLADTWVWLTATVDDPADRQTYLETALRHEPRHPLARDALGFARGETPYPGEEREDRIALSKCPHCGGELHYEPGATEVACPHCGRMTALPYVTNPDAGAEPVSHLQLRRMFRRQAWAGTDRLVQSRACGADLALTRYQSRRCVFCGSTNVLIVDAQRFLERPDSFLPFKLDKQRARDAIRALQQASLEGFLAWWSAWNGPRLGCLLIHPGGLLRTLDTWSASRSSEVSSIAGVYLPFWLFDGIIEIHRRYGTDAFVPPMVQRKAFDNLVWPGVNQPRASLIEKLHPFDWQTLAPYEPHLLADWPIRVHGLDVESLIAEIRQRVIAEVKRQTTGLRLPPMVTEARIPSGLRITASPPEYRVHDMTYRLVLAPVWIAILTHREERLLALVNGQTGKVALELLDRRAKR